MSPIRNIISLLFFYSAAVIWPAVSFAQPVKKTTHTTTSNISFQHLNTGNGLSYSGVNDMCADQKGNLWLATGNGLNMFNGKSVEKYFATDHPQLKSSNILQLTCDNKNRVWVLTAGATHLTSKTLGEYDTLLNPHHFIRTHKSHLVNKKFITFIDHDGYAVLKDNTKVEISRRRKEDVLQALK